MVQFLQDFPGYTNTKLPRTFELQPKGAMPPRKAQPRLSGQLLPQLAKPGSVVGEFIEIQGREWGSCPAADKDKWFKCIIRAFDAVHDFPGGSKSAGYQVQEMGETGEGSLEPGVASGDVFWVCSPTPFLKHFYKANPDRLPDGHRDKPAAAVTTASPAPAAAASTNAPADAPLASPTIPTGLPVVKQEATVYNFFELSSDESHVRQAEQVASKQQHDYSRQRGGQTVRQAQRCSFAAQRGQQESGSLA
mmetsp:Transcript_148/g.313  ORF Transcript_148/g.313 Transcript_148/m.313 type:complete len:249 (-) Transcript_148:146-892(-)